MQQTTTTTTAKWIIYRKSIGFLAHDYPSSDTLVNTALRFFFSGPSTSALGSLVLAPTSDSSAASCRIPMEFSSALNGGGESTRRLFNETVVLTTEAVVGGSVSEGIDGVDAGVAAGVLEYNIGTEL